MSTALAGSLLDSAALSSEAVADYHKRFCCDTCKGVQEILISDPIILTVSSVESRPASSKALTITSGSTATPGDPEKLVSNPVAVTAAGVIPPDEPG